MEQDVGAIVVAYWPLPEQISSLIAALVAQCQVVYVMDNGGGRDAILNSCGTRPTLRIVQMNGNQGIGAALNIGFQLAREDGLDYVLTFDQDSLPPSSLTAELVNAMEQIESAGVRVAAVGPTTVDVRTGATHRSMRTHMGWPAKVDASSEFVEVDYLITSGSLTRVAAYETVGRFNEDLFVDYTDMEWCFRAKDAGYRMFVIGSTRMSHELGGGADSSIMGLTILDHSPVRRYYYARNTVRLLTMPHVSRGWKLRMLMGLAARVALLPMTNRFREGWRKDWLMLAKGVVHGFTGERGPFKQQNPL